MWKAFLGNVQKYCTILLYSINSLFSVFCANLHQICLHSAYIQITLSKTHCSQPGVSRERSKLWGDRTKRTGSFFLAWELLLLGVILSHNTHTVPSTCEVSLSFQSLHVKIWALGDVATISITVKVVLSQTDLYFDRTIMELNYTHKSVVNSQSFSASGNLFFFMFYHFAFVCITEICTFLDYSWLKKFFLKL